MRRWWRRLKPAGRYHHHDGKHILATFNVRKDVSSSVFNIINFTRKNISMVLLILLLSLSENVCSIFRKAFYQRHRDFELNVVSFTVSAMLIGY